MLVSGILSSLLYVAMLVIIAMQWNGYSSASQTISELSAIGAPTRSLWLIPGAVYTVLVTAFGFGVWISAGRIRALRAVGGLIATGGTDLVTRSRPEGQVSPGFDAVRDAFADNFARTTR